MTTDDELPPGWCWSVIGEVGEVRLGRQRSPSNRSKLHPTKYLRAANITWEGLDLSEVLDMDFTPAEQEVYRLRVGDVLLSEASGSATEVGKPAVWRGEIDNCCFQNTVIRFRSRCVEPAYAHIAFNHLARNGVFAKVSKGVGIQHLSADRFAQLRFPLPPAHEQLRIVAKVDELLSDLDAGVAALERARANLKNYRAAVLKAAVTGELTADWRAAHPHVEPATKLLDRILAERRRKWEADQQARFVAAGKPPPKNWQAKYTPPPAPDTTGLPKLPPSWTWTSVEQVAALVTDGEHNPPPRAESGVPYLTAKHLKGGRVTFDRCTFISPADFERVRKRYSPLEGDILITCVGAKVGEVSIVAEGQVFGADRNLAVVRVSEGFGSGRFVMTALQSPYWQHRMANASGSSAQPHLYLADLRTIPLPLPSLDEQEAIVAEVEERLSVIAATAAYIDASLKRAGRLRQSILKEAFAGRLVPQDPNDEPASALLDRIRAANGAVACRRRGSRRTSEATDGSA